MQLVMRLRQAIYLSVLPLFFPVSVSAQENPIAASSQDSNTKIYVISPAKDITLSAMAISFSMTGLVMDYRVGGVTAEEVSELDSSAINRFDRSATNHWSPVAATASDLTLISMTAMPLVFTLQKFISREKTLGLTLLLMYAEAVGINFGLTSIIKGAAQRKRPFVYNDTLTIDEKLSEHDPRLSFVSGHTSLAFCSASFLSITFTQLHPNSPWRFVVWPVSFGIAGTTGFLRFAAGKHFPTDILGAAAVGVFTGLIVPILHKSNHQRVAIYPLTGNIRGVGATIAF